MQEGGTLAKRRNLTEKQKRAIELLTCGKGLTYKQIAEEVGIDVKNLYRWRSSPDFAQFQEELARINNARWQAAVDAARQGAIKLCQNGNQKMIQFVLQNEGYNPTQKVEAELHNDIIIEIGEEGEEQNVD